MNYGTPTNVDMLHAFAYAQMQVTKMKCEDPEIVQGVCTATGAPGNAGGGKCIEWRQDESLRTFPKPSNYYINKCSSDADCAMGKCAADGLCRCDYTNPASCNNGMSCLPDPNTPGFNMCGFAPKDVAVGHCVFNNERACVAQGQVPYICGDDGCKTRPKEQLIYPYTEWHDGKCIAGNFLLKQWCENPTSRCMKNADGTYPDQCKGGANSKGVTDVPPFYYDSSKGMCYMSHDYCKAFGLDYNKNSCDKDSGCPGKDNICAEDCQDETRKLCLGSHCTGPDAKCYESTGQQVGEFFIGKTLFYLFKNNFKCENYENPKVSEIKVLNNSIKEKFSKTHDTVSVSEGKIKNKKVLVKDFAGPGINLYILEKEKDGGPNEEIGFLVSEVKKVYPELIEKNKGENYIVVNREEAGKNKNINRIYMTLSSRGWMKNMVSSILSSK